MARGEAGECAGQQAEARGLVPEAAGAGQSRGMLDCVRLKHSKTWLRWVHTSRHKAKRGRGR